MKLLHFFAIIFVVSIASVGSDRRRQPGQGPPPPGGPRPPKDGPPPKNGTFNGNASRGDSTPAWMTGNVTLKTMNITSNGVEYFNVRFINETTMERIELDVGFFTIPAGCYPCVGAYWCANYLHPPPCRSDPECDFNDEVKGCEEMYSSPAEKLAMCQECHANGTDYCIIQNRCIEPPYGSCTDHIISTNSTLISLGYPADCRLLVEINDTMMGAVTEDIRNLNMLIILSCAAGLTLFFCACFIISCCRKDPATSFDTKMFDKYDEAAGNELDSMEGGTVPSSAFNADTAVKV